MSVGARHNQLNRIRGRAITPARLKRAISAVLEYNWKDEYEDFVHGDMKLSSHVIKHLVVLDEWLAKIKTLKWPLTEKGKA